MTSDIVSIAPKPSLLSPEREREIYESSPKAGKAIGAALSRGVEMLVDARTAAQADEIAALRARVEALERAIQPREV
jgi:polyhydroxyalkanoate synthesis regulator phasin